MGMLRGIDGKHHLWVCSLEPTDHSETNFPWLTFCRPKLAMVGWFDYGLHAYCTCDGFNTCFFLNLAVEDS